MAHIEEGRRAASRDAKTKGSSATADSRRRFLDMDSDEEDFGQRASPVAAEDLSGEPQGSQSDELRTNKLVRFAKELIPSAGDADWPGNCDETLRRYFENPVYALMTVSRDSDDGWKMTLKGPPKGAPKSFVYFLRTSHQRIYTPANFRQNVIYGSVGGEPGRCVLAMMENAYEHFATCSPGESPRATRRDLRKDLHDFLARMKDRLYKSSNLTVLYVPREGSRGLSQYENAARAGLIERLESVVSYWIGQIARTRSTRSGGCNDDGNETIEDELRHWSATYSAWACTRAQLRHRRVRSIVDSLAAIGSPIARTFRDLADRVDARVLDSSLRVRYLTVLEESCRSLDVVLDTEGYARRALLLVFAICAEPPFCDSFAQNAERLCRVLVSQLIARCRDYVNLDAVFAGDVRAAVIALKRCVSCCQIYESVHREIARRIAADPLRRENRSLNDDQIFNRLRIFVNRCHDVIDLCGAFAIFGSCDKVGTFPGANGTVCEARCREIESTFYAHLMGIIMIRNDILNVTKSEWRQARIRFRSAVNRLETMVVDLIHVTFENVRTVEEGVEALYTLSRFRHSQRFRAALNERYIHVWQIFGTEIDAVANFAREVDGRPTRTRRAYRCEDWKIKRRYLEAIRTAVTNSIDWLEDCPSIADRTLLRHTRLRNALNISLLQVSQKDSAGHVDVAHH